MRIIIFAAGLLVGFSAAHGYQLSVPDTYTHDLKATAALVASYVKHWDEHKAWPEPGTGRNDHLIFKSSEPTSKEFPDRRRDFYRTLDGGGRQLDVILWKDGRIEIRALVPGAC
jgi:hypothetical protein